MFRFITHASKLIRIPTRSFCSHPKRGITHSPNMTPVQAHIVNAQKYITMNQLKYAQLQLQRAEQTNIPQQDLAVYYMVKGQIQMNRQQPNYSMAVKHFNTSLQHKGNHQLSVCNRKIECLRQAGLVQLYFMNIDNIISKGQAKPYQYLQKAQYLFFQKQFEEAQQLYTKCLELGLDNNPQIFKNRAICVSSTGDLNKALQDFQRYIAVVPDDMSSLLAVLAIHWKLTNYPKVIEMCDKILLLDPSFDEAYLFKGRSLLFLDKPKQAISAVEKISFPQGQQTDLPQKYQIRGMALSLTGNYEQAIQDLQLALQSSSRGYLFRGCQIASQLCSLHNYKNNKQKVKEYAQSAIKQSSEADPDCILKVVLILLGNGQQQVARQLLNQKSGSGSLETMKNCINRIGDSPTTQATKEFVQLFQLAQKYRLETYFTSLVNTLPTQLQQSINTQINNLNKH